jgi:hypothetical protein
MKVVDALVTNFHLPRSTLLALVMAFGGVEPCARPTRGLRRERYRFFSYGDAMLVRCGRGTRRHDHDPGFSFDADARDGHARTGRSPPRTARSRRPPSCPWARRAR